MVERRTLLSENMLAFGRYLRKQAGIRVDMGSLQEALDAIQYIDIGDPQQFRRSLKSIFCKTRAEWIDFDNHYEQYWRTLNRALNSKEKQGDLQEKVKQGKKQYSIQEIKSWLYQNDEQQKGKTFETALYGLGIEDRPGNLDRFDELRTVQYLVKKWHAQESFGSSRRKVNHGSKGVLNLQKIIEQTAKGKDAQFYYKFPKQKEIRIVVLFDVSRSMSMYQIFYIALIKAIHYHFPIAYSYGFHTELFDTNDMFNHWDYERTLAELENIRGIYSSGTQIGLSVQTYVEKHASAQINNRTIMLVISDGWDTGDPSVLVESMQHLYYRSNKVLWFNPVMQYGYANLPDTMQNVLPYINQLLPVYSIESMTSFVDNES